MQVRIDDMDIIIYLVTWPTIDISYDVISNIQPKRQGKTSSI